MKNLLTVSALSAVLFVSNFAQADFRPGRVRPIMKANLEVLDNEKPTLAFPLARTIFLNKQDELRKPVSFTVRFDTGIRCVTAPCPSFKNVEFKITDIVEEFGGSVTKYTAYEVLRGIPPHVKMARRKLIVRESDMELVAEGGQGFEHKTIWDVEISRMSEMNRYRGEAEALMVTMSINPLNVQ